MIIAVNLLSDNRFRVVSRRSCVFEESFCGVSPACIDYADGSACMVPARGPSKTTHDDGSPGHRSPVK
jgi:hypothetical protein